MKSNQLSLNPKSIIWILGGIAFFLVILSVGVQLLFYSFTTPPPYVETLNFYFYVGKEQNFPTYFSSSLFLISALLLLIITALEKNQKNPYVFKWAFLAICFLFLAFDEVFCIHEKLNNKIPELLNKENYGIFYYPWIIPYVAFILILSIVYLKFFFQLNAKTRLNFLIAAIIYISGVIIFNNIGGIFKGVYGKYLLYYIMVTIEESLEMAGIILFIRGLLLYISDKYKAIQFNFISDIKH